MKTYIEGVIDTLKEVKRVFNNGATRKDMYIWAITKLHQIQTEKKKHDEQDRQTDPKG